MVAGGSAGGAAAIFLGSSAMAAAVASATAKKQTAVLDNPGFMPPIVEAEPRQRQAFGVLRRNAGAARANSRLIEFWTLGAHTIFNSDIRQFWYVAFADCTVKQVVVAEWG